MIKIFLIVLILIPLSSFQTDSQPQYLRVRLSQDMTTDDLLSRYLLNDYDCNVSQFLKINQLTKKGLLSKGKELNLPILIYEYNGKNIRSSTGIGDLDIAKSIQSYNVDLLKIGLRQQTYQKSGYILVPNHILNCRNAVKKPKKETEKINEPELEKPIAASKTKIPSSKPVTQAIFGKKYEEVVVVDKKLKGKIFYVEGGHGGPDPGAQTKVNGRTLSEDEYAYDVSLRVARELIKHGGTVFIINRDPNDGIRDGEFLTSDTDEQTYPDLKVPAHQKTRLFQRSDAVNLLYEKYKAKGFTDQRLIVIHVDSRGKKEQIDTFLYYQNGNEESHDLAKKMQQNLERHYARYREYKGTLTTRDLHMLRECKPTTVFIEIGNIRNELDRKRIMIANNRQAIASWLAEGFMK